MVQSIKTGPVESTGRGVALVGITSQTVNTTPSLDRSRYILLTHKDTLLLLEKRVKSRFSHRVWRVTSPLSPSPGGLAVPEGEKAWRVLLRRALVPWTNSAGSNAAAANGAEEADTKRWKGDWSFAIDVS